MKAIRVSTWLVRKGEHPGWSASGDPVTVGKGEPDLYAHVVKLGRYQTWKITVGKRGQVLAYGSCWWLWRAKLRARTVAQSPKILQQIRIRGAL